VTSPVILATQEAEVEGSWFEASPGFKKKKRETLSEKYPALKRAGGVVSACLASMMP
jgi:hypothetical protein